MSVVAATPVRRLLCAFALALAFVTPTVFAQQRVSIQGSSVNLRSGPGTSAEAVWELSRGYPLRVIGRKGSWLHVRDFEGDTGWVARSLTGAVPHHVVKSSVANLRNGPGTRHRVLARLQHGEVLRTLAQRNGWVRVRLQDGRSGWVSKGLLWGW